MNDTDQAEVPYDLNDCRFDNCLTCESEECIYEKCRYSQGGVQYCDHYEQGEKRTCADMESEGE